MKKLLLLVFLLIYTPCFASTILLTTALDEAGVHARVAAYLSATSDTTVATAETFVPIFGTFTNSPMNEFTVVVDLIRYDHAVTQEFEIDWSASVSSVDAGRTVYIGISKNEAVITILDRTSMSEFLKYADETLVMSGTTVVELSTNDTIQLQVTSSANADVITFHNLTTTIKPFAIGM